MLKQSLTFWTRVTVLAKFLQDLGKTFTLYSVNEREREHEIIEHCNVVASVPAFYR